MQISLLRPVGSRVPVPAREEPLRGFPWDDQYQTELLDSGTSALSLAVQLSVDACQVPGRPEVILPAYGCPDLVAAVLFQGVKPVLVDLKPESPHLSLDAVEKALTPNTVAVIAVDFLGLHENLAEIKRLLSGTGSWLIEDSAQAFPPASSSSGLADSVILSFGRGKPINLMGGGALLVRRDHLKLAAPSLQRLPQDSLSTGAAWRLRRVVFNGLLTRFFYGLLARLPFLGLGKTEFVPVEAIRRLELSSQLLQAGIHGHRRRPYLLQAYCNALYVLEERGWCGPGVLARSWGGVSDADELPRLLRLPVLAPSFEIRDKAIVALNEAGIGANSLYGVPLPAISSLGDELGVREWEFPNACDFSERLITLPLHEDVTRADIEHIANILRRFTV